MTTADQRELVAALLSVDGVADAAVEDADDESGAGGPGSLRLLLRPGADEVGVATAVNRVLRDRFGLAVDSDRVAVVEEPPEPGSTASAKSVRADPVKASGTKARPEIPARTGEAAPGAKSGGSARGGPTSGAPAAGGPTAGSAPTAASVLAEAEARQERSGAVQARGGMQAVAAGVGSEGPPRTVEVAGAELPKPLGAPSPAGSGRRPTIERVEVVTSGLSVTTAVTLALDGRTETGRAEGMASASGVHRTVAAATLDAVQELVEGAARFQLEHVEIASAAGERTALALVTMLTGRGGEQLAGSSVVREDQRQAVIRAVLAAVNRRVEPLLG